MNIIILCWSIIFHALIQNYLLNQLYAHYQSFDFIVTLSQSMGSYCSSLQCGQTKSGSVRTATNNSPSWRCLKHTTKAPTISQNWKDDRSAENIKSVRRKMLTNIYINNITDQWTISLYHNCTIFEFHQYFLPLKKNISQTLHMTSIEVFYWFSNYRY